MKRIIVLLLAVLVFLPLASAKPQVQLSGPIYGVPDNVNIGLIVYTDYYRGDNVTGWNNETSYTVTLSAHTYYLVYADFTGFNGTSGECLGAVGKFSNTSPLDTPLFLYCYED